MSLIGSKISTIVGCLLCRVILLLPLAVWSARAQLVPTAPPNTTGDNGPALSAEIDGPLALALDDADNLYIYQKATHYKGLLAISEDIGSVRRVDSHEHTIRTVAFECDPNERDSLPSDCFDRITQLGVAPGSEDILFSEFLRGRVRALNLKTGQLRVVAGNGDRRSHRDDTSAFKLVHCFAVDQFGNIFLCADNYIRRVDAKTGNVSTMAGNGTRGFSGDGGPAVSAQLDQPQSLAIDRVGNLYVTDDLSNRIRRIEASTGIIDTIAGKGATGRQGPDEFSGEGRPATEARIAPRDLVVGPDGDLFFIAGNAFTSRSARICRIDHISGILTTIAGNNPWGYSGDGGPALSAMVDPTSLAVDHQGNILIAEYENNRIRRVDAKTGIITTIAGNGLPHRDHMPMAGNNSARPLLVGGYAASEHAVAQLRIYP